MQVYKAIILAAGRGSRMNALTADKPKCKLELLGKPLLEWQIESLNKAGIENILVVAGYKNECIQGDFQKIINDRWANSNMVSSLQCALLNLEKQNILISYADIVYSSNHIKKLMQATGDICITYDEFWQDLWAMRAENTTNDILADAETFKFNNDILLEIGKKPSSLSEVQGQYMGLIKLSANGLQIIKDVLANLPQEKIDQFDMTSFLSFLLEKGYTINVVPVQGAWCECDTQEDILKYEQMLQNNHWKHDWRK